MADPLATKQGRYVAIFVLLVILMIFAGFLLYNYFINRGSNPTFLANLANDLNIGL